jgi:hypothetical protein
VPKVMVMGGGERLRGEREMKEERENEEGK